MKIIGFIKTSLIDWDGHVAASIYLPGCNFRCPFCHNRDAVLNPEIFDEVPWEEVEEFVRENGDFLDGVVVTGGEPTIHDDLPDLLRRIKALGVKVKLDTNGSNPRMLKDVIDAGLVDYVAMDIKAPLNEKYHDLAGTDAPLDDIKRSIEVLETSGIDHEYRTTLVPILLNASDIETIAAYIGGTKKYALQQFRPSRTLDPLMENASPMPRSQVKAIAENAKRYVRKVVIRGDV
ncbi:MAG: anaerobic ribonucleoside-triphosphate reductase activating protein [Methanomassiliicoccaceae archaeon]|jgi:pyruvate formate lyase activating enzyme|nr:anaerobic ribonucleoside-triphosphate reductase activating protein [Euryarchaeota archaeon]HOB37750.1 anaerobic ribonucleoside-triphosphate reductase activating protein [Methanomassiliicoccaceae archaeon]HOL06826.1 anaerobic ribonucleoside-triphosphate reductase activating protein [Methanomassiliicoccaceae archaeon]HOQ25402.1 anaerobic ribonucleoside-triphosphate reductase activating protein [Methanomassiliicoccaceae archaeon]HPP44204.1 anaerobic ribonucleoside-triphosphate reductase activat